MAINDAIGWLLVGVVLSQLALLVLAAGRGGAAGQRARWREQYERERKHRDNSVDK